jgi:hypothetical protein
MAAAGTAPTIPAKPSPGVAALPADIAAIGMAKAPVERAQPRPAVRTASLMCIAWSPFALLCRQYRTTAFVPLGLCFVLAERRIGPAGGPMQP